jgi:drug/metabolite transporter (DMT)-like permease
LKNDRLAVCYALGAVLMWSTVATAFKLSLERLSLLNLLAGASFFSLLSLSAFLIVTTEIGKALKTFLHYWQPSLMLGLLNPIIYYIILFKAYDQLPAQIAQSLNYTWAITLTLLSVPILKHKIVLGDIVAIILGYSGVVLIILSSGKVAGKVDILGVALALVSTVIWALYWLINAKDKRKPIIKLFHSFLFATPLLIIASFIIEDINPFSAETLPYVAYVGLFEMGLAFIFWQLAIQTTTRVSNISTLIFLSPIISLVIINRVLDEPIGMLTIFGLCLILSGILFQQVYNQKIIK